MDEAEEELLKLSGSGISFVGCTDPEYPQILLDCEDAPLGLYIKSGTPISDLFAPERKIAIVGTRDISPYGQDWCNRIVQGLGQASEKPLIISGLALGTDICAHRNALEAGLPTIAVMTAQIRPTKPRMPNSTPTVAIKVIGFTERLVIPSKASANIFLSG